MQDSQKWRNRNEVAPEAYPVRPADRLRTFGAGMNSDSPVAAPRIEALDALRGLIMLLMALDHSAYFVAGYHATEIWGLPVPVHASEFGFVTRLVGHVCAPGFFLLMGIGMTLFATSRRGRGWSEGRIARLGQPAVTVAFG